LALIVGHNFSFSLISKGGRADKPPIQSLYHPCYGVVVVDVLVLDVELEVDDVELDVLDVELEVLDVEVVIVVVDVELDVDEVEVVIEYSGTSLSVVPSDQLS